MALVPCRECGQQVSTEATSCPHCGARVVLYSQWEQFKKEGGWVTLVISVLLGQATATGVLKSVNSGPTLDANGWDVFLGLFVVTTPLTVASIIFFALLFAGQIKDLITGVFAGGLSLIAGAGIGGSLGNATAVALNKAHVPPPPQVSGPWGVFFAILWTLAGYYLVYGWAYFVSSILMGGFFGKWAAWLIQDRKLRA